MGKRITVKKEWVTFKVNENFILTETASAVLLRVPDVEELKEFCFWFPKKFIKDGTKASVPADFEIKIFKSGETTGEKRDLDERTIPATFFNKHHYPGDDLVRYFEIVPEPLEPLTKAGPDETLLR